MDFLFIEFPFLNITLFFGKRGDYAIVEYITVV